MGKNSRPDYEAILAGYSAISAASFLNLASVVTKLVRFRSADRERLAKTDTVRITFLRNANRGAVLPQTGKSGAMMTKRALLARSKASQASRFVYAEVIDTEDSQTQRQEKVGRIRNAVHNRAMRWRDTHEVPKLPVQGSSKRPVVLKDQARDSAIRVDKDIATLLGAKRA